MPTQACDTELGEMAAVGVRAHATLAVPTMAAQQRDIPSLDGLRGISILMVLGGHLMMSGAAPTYLRPIASLFNGGLGVRVFFVISGFLITSLLIRERLATGKVSLQNFYVRRFLRLAPVQFAFVAMLFLLTRVTALTMSPCQFATALTYTKNYACGDWVDGHLWSLSVEEQFYLLWPALFALTPRRVWLPAAIGLIAVSAPSRAVEYLMGNRTWFWLTSNADALMSGSLLAVAVNAWPTLATKMCARRPFMGRIAAAVIIAVPEVLKTHLLLAPVTVMLGPLVQAVAISYLILSWTSHRAGASFALLNTRPLMLLGAISYSVYVWQEVFLSRPDVFRLTVRPWPLSYPADLLLAVGVGALSYLLLERPFVALRRRFQTGRRTAPRRGTADLLTSVPAEAL